MLPILNNGLDLFGRQTFYVPSFISICCIMAETNGHNHPSKSVIKFGFRSQEQELNLLLLNMLGLIFHTPLSFPDPQFRKRKFVSQFKINIFLRACVGQEQDSLCPCAVKLTCSVQKCKKKTSRKSGLILSITHHRYDKGIKVHSS